MIVQRGYLRPPSFHEDRLRQIADGHLFDVITRGFGQMPSYASQVPRDDRWAIVAYVRALQLSQDAELAALPPEVRQVAERALAGHPRPPRREPEAPAPTPPGGAPVGAPVGEPVSAPDRPSCIPATRRRRRPRPRTARPAPGMRATSSPASSPAGSRNDDPAAPRRWTTDALDRLQVPALVVGVVALVLCVVGWVVDPAQFYPSWLLGVVYWLGISIGCLALSMIHHLTGGTWGVPVRRVWEAAAGLLPLLALLFVPLAFGIEVLYPWARQAAADDPILQHKAAYLNEPFFLARFALYFLVWIGLAWSLRRLSDRQDRAADPRLTKRAQVIAAPGLVLWAFVTTFAYVDWLMSLEPHWFSTIYGVYFFGGSGWRRWPSSSVAGVLLARRAPFDHWLGRATSTTGASCSSPSSCCGPTSRSPSS
jgi:putative effector of murein hydrolase LrgA (UPF0299 family)